MEVEAKCVSCLNGSECGIVLKTEMGIVVVVVVVVEDEDEDEREIRRRKRERRRDEEKAILILVLGKRVGKQDMVSLRW